MGVDAHRERLVQLGYGAGSMGLGPWGWGSMGLGPWGWGYGARSIGWLDASSLRLALAVGAKAG